MALIPDLDTIAAHRRSAQDLRSVSTRLATAFLWSDTLKGYIYWEEVKAQLLHEAHRQDDQADELSAKLEAETRERPAAVFEIKVKRWTPTSRWAK